ncbi:hypothetical protein RB195_023427 [Necator americanus]
MFAELRREFRENYKELREQIKNANESIEMIKLSIEELKEHTESTTDKQHDSKDREPTRHLGDDPMLPAPEHGEEQPHETAEHQRPEEDLLDSTAKESGAAKTKGCTQSDSWKQRKSARQKDQPCQLHETGGTLPGVFIPLDKRYHNKALCTLPESIHDQRWELEEIERELETFAEYYGPPTIGAAEYHRGD